MIEKVNNTTHKPFWGCFFPHRNGNLNIHRPISAPTRPVEEDAEVEAITRRAMQMMRVERGIPGPPDATEVAHMCEADLALLRKQLYRDQ
eukprot:9476961-Heterocapsa_arctica.AAC.1